MSVPLLLGLLVCNVLWSGVYSISKHLMQAGYRPLEVAFLRFLVGALPLLVIFFRGGPRSPLRKWVKDLGTVDVRIALVGFCTFFLSPLLQLSGLNLSRAVDGSLMIALEPLVTILAACLMLGERLRLNQAAALVLALFGVSVLTELNWQKLGTLVDARLIGNLVMMASLVTESLYSTLSKPGLGRRSPTTFFTVACTLGAVLLGATNLFVDSSRAAGFAPLFARCDPWDFAAIAYLGLGCTSFAYLFWMHALKHASVSVITITLYVQPVLGMVWGALWLGEEITSSTLGGAALILGAVWLASRAGR